MTCTENGPLALVAYAQNHIGNTLWMQTQGRTT